MLLTLALTIHAADRHAIQQFIESQRDGTMGPGKITLTSEVDMNGDGVGDLFVAYTYQDLDPPVNRIYGKFIVAFLSTPAATFEPTNVLFVCDAEMMIYHDFSVEAVGQNVRVTGLRRLPEDAMCCPTGRHAMVFGLRDGDLSYIEGRWWNDPGLEP